MNTAIYFGTKLPWESANQENGKFTRISVVILLLTLLFAGYVSITELPEISREEQEQLPPQLARIIQAQEPPPPPPQIEPEPEPEPEPEIEEPPEEVIEEAVPAQEETPAPPPQEEVKLSEQEEVQKARETAKSKGVLAFSNALSSMRDMANLNNMANTQQTQGGGQAEETQRATIAAPNVATSGGIQTGQVSSDVGAAGELEGRRNTEFVAASEGEAALATKRVEESNQVIGSRDLDKIRQTLDANKGAVYSLYRRALRQDPTIEGKLTVKLVIEPDGSLSIVDLIDSELDAPELVEKLLQRISLINFGPAQATRTELEYAYNFLPF